MLRAAVNRDRINNALARMYEGEQSRHNGGHAGVENQCGMRSCFQRDHLIFQELGVGMIEPRINQVRLFVFGWLRTSGHQVERTLGRFGAGKNIGGATKRRPSRRSYRKAGIETARHYLRMRPKYGIMLIGHFSTPNSSVTVPEKPTPSRSRFGNTIRYETRAPASLCF